MYASISDARRQQHTPYRPYERRTVSLDETSVAIEFALGLYDIEPLPFRR